MREDHRGIPGDGIPDVSDPHEADGMLRRRQTAKLLKCLCRLARRGELEGRLAIRLVYAQSAPECAVTQHREVIAVERIAARVQRLRVIRRAEHIVPRAAVGDRDPAFKIFREDLLRVLADLVRRFLRHEITAARMRFDRPGCLCRAAFAAGGQPEQAQQHPKRNINCLFHSNLHDPLRPCAPDHPQFT